MKKTLLFACGLGLGAFQAFAQCPVGESEVIVNIVLDRYGSETTWSVTGPGGSPTYASGSDYADEAANGEYPLDPVTFCVPNGTQIIFEVDDSYGDGMCCAYGEGGYTITVDGQEVASGGSFTTTQSSSVFLGTDLGIAGLNMESVIAQGPLTITGTVVNGGTTSVSDFTLTYMVDGGAPVSTSVTATIPAGGSYDFSHPTPWDASLGSHDLAVEISDVAGDGVESNNSFDGEVGVASESVERVTVIEQFTSSTCPPCASLNVTFGPTLTGLNTNAPGNNVAAIKYHMNWPAPGNDPSYNPDGNTRKSYYGVTGIPDLFIDGKPMTSVAASYIEEQAARDAFVDLDLSYWTNGNQIGVTADVTPFWAYTGAHKVHIAIVENSYDYAASTTTQDEFHYVQRKMMPNGQGSNLSAFVPGTTQSFNLTHNMVFGSPAQGNYNAWGNDISDLTIVAFVQNTSTKEVLQAAVASVVVGVEENVLDQRLRVFPNPTDGLLNVQFEAPANGTAQIEVFNVLGERVFGTTRAMGAGVQRETLDLSALTGGIYFVNITADGVRASRKVTLND